MRFVGIFYAERLLLPFSVEGQVSRSDERYLFINTNVIFHSLQIAETCMVQISRPEQCFSSTKKRPDYSIRV